MCVCLSVYHLYANVISLSISINLSEPPFLCVCFYICLYVTCISVCGLCFIVYLHAWSVFLCVVYISVCVSVCLICISVCDFVCGLHFCVCLSVCDLYFCVCLSASDLCVSLCAIYISVCVSLRVACRSMCVFA